MSAFTQILIYVGGPALALGSLAWRVSRAVLLHRAGAAALKHGSEDQRREAGLEIIKALTDADEPWYLKALPWRKSDDGSGP